MIYKIIKRLFDILISTIVIFTLSPIMFFIALSIKINSTGGIFYHGIRAGKGDINFSILKFRTMISDAESKGGFSTALNDYRLTSIGRFLRKYKLDELPQFINVIKGDMSLVGPRPQVLYYTDQYKGELKLILSVRPGITDLASLYFSDMDATLGVGDVKNIYETKIEPVKNLLRLRYVREQNFIMDVRILIETAFSIVGVKNITNLNIKP